MLMLQFISGRDLKWCHL